MGDLVETQVEVSWPCALDHASGWHGQHLWGFTICGYLALLHQPPGTSGCIQSVGASQPSSGVPGTESRVRNTAPELLSGPHPHGVLLCGGEMRWPGEAGGWDLAEEGQEPWSAPGTLWVSKTPAWPCSERHSEFDLGINGKSHGL